MSREIFYDYRESLALRIGGMYVPSIRENDYVIPIFWRLYSYASTLLEAFMLLTGFASLVDPNIGKRDLFENLHFILVILVVGSMRHVHLHHFNLLDDALMFAKDVVSVEGNERCEYLKQKGISKIEKRKSFFQSIMIVWCIGFTTLTPIQGVVTNGRKHSFVSKNLLNLPTYLTFLDDSPGHVVIGLVLFGFTTLVISATVVSVFDAYFSVTVQFQTLFNLLCESIDRIESRALEKFERMEIDDFDGGTLACLKENVMQFQIIQNNVRNGLPYFNLIFTVLAFLASITIAIAGYMFTQVQLEKGDWLKYLMTSFGEGLFTFFICQSAERIKNSCLKVFKHVTWTPWYKFSVKYRKDMLFFLLSLKKPVLVQARPFDLNASNENYYLMMRATINYMTLLKSL